MRHITRRRLGIPFALWAAGLAGLLCLPVAARAQITADAILSNMGLSADDKQKVLNGEFVTANVPGVSDRDLAFAIAFLVKATPEAVSKQIVAGQLITADAQVQSNGEFANPGSLADLAKLKITDDEAKALAGAKPGDAINLSTSEFAAFQAIGSGTPQAVLPVLQQMLLARYQAYRSSGLAGIAPYDRGGGKKSDLAPDLRKATEALKVLQKEMPGFYAVLLNYPKATLPGMTENFFWTRSVIEKKPTYALSHVLAAADGPNRAVVRRQYYASTGYNGEQTVAGFLPVQGGTVAVCISHAFTDQVTGFGGSMKRSIGSNIMASKMKEIFESGRKKVNQ